MAAKDDHESHVYFYVLLGVIAFGAGVVAHLGVLHRWHLAGWRSTIDVGSVVFFVFAVVAGRLSALGRARGILRAVAGGLSIAMGLAFFVIDFERISAEAQAWRRRLDLIAVLLGLGFISYGISVLLRMKSKAEDKPPTPG